MEPRKDPNEEIDRILADFQQSRTRRQQRRRQSRLFRQKKEKRRQKRKALQRSKAAKKGKAPRRPLNKSKSGGCGSPWCAW